MLLKKLHKMNVIHRTGDGSLEQEVAEAGLLPSPSGEYQRMGKVSTHVWTPGMQVVKQGLQAANTGMGQ